MQAPSSPASAVPGGLLSQILAFPLLSSRSAPSITWSKCQIDVPRLDCGKIQVPIDYAKPNGDNFTLFISRLKVANTTSRVGSLVFNPGGPGSGASDIVSATAQGAKGFFSASLLDSYDIIGLDPRGTGESSAVQCDPDIFNERIPVFPKTEDDFNKLVSRNKAFAQSCRQKTGLLFEHLDTTHCVKDIELVRQALDDGKLNFLGLSYGTQIGAAYAELYPENVGRMVLDGITDHSSTEIAAIASETVTFELTLNKFFQWCMATAACALHGRDAAAIFDSIIKTASETPIPAPWMLSGK